MASEPAGTARGIRAEGDRPSGSSAIRVAARGALGGLAALALLFACGDGHPTAPAVTRSDVL